MKLDDLYPSRWLKATDLTTPILATVKSVVIEEIASDEDKPVLTITSPTSSQALETSAKAQGSATDDDGLATIEYALDLDNNGSFGDTVSEATLGRDLNNDGDQLDSFVEGYQNVASPASPSGTAAKTTTRSSASRCATRSSSRRSPARWRSRPACSTPAPRARRAPARTTS